LFWPTQREEEKKRRRESLLSGKTTSNIAETSVYSKLVGEIAFAATRIGEERGRREN
jgi:hypothetical protein